MTDLNVTDYQFCRNCELNSSCTKIGLPKILRINNMVIKYIYNFENKIREYPNGGSWRDQPVWFNVLFEHGQSVLNKLRAKSRENKETYND